MRIWVTGAAGQIGRVLVPQLQDLGHDVFTLGRRPLSNPAIPHHHWDASDKIQFSTSLEEPDVVVHLASQTSPYLARESPSEDCVINVVGPLRLMDAVHEKGWCPTVILAGALTEADHKDGPITFDSADDPQTFYDVAKVALRTYLEQYEREGWIDLVSLQLANVYGGMPSAANADRGFINLCLRRAINGQPLTYFGDGEYLRDYIHVTDVASAITHAIQFRDALRGHRFPVGTGQSISIKDALDIIAQEAANVGATSSDVMSVPQPPERYEIEMRDALIATEEFRRRTGWTPRLGFRRGVQVSLEAILGQRVS